MLARRQVFLAIGWSDSITCQKRSQLLYRYVASKLSPHGTEEPKGARAKRGDHKCLDGWPAEGMPPSEFSMGLLPSRT
jgi:hypothetical protein